MQDHNIASGESSQAPIPLFAKHTSRPEPDLGPWPSLLVPVWHVVLRAVPGPWGLRANPAGVHSVVSKWLHRNQDHDTGEAHANDHRYSVMWRQVSETLLRMELRLLDDALTPVLLSRVEVGTSVRLGRVELQVIGVEEVQVVDLAGFPGSPARGWRIGFPAGITFKRADAFMPWPSPHAVLGSIQRRVALAYGWEPQRQRLSSQVSNTVLPVAVDLQTRRWPEGDGRRGRARDVAVAVGEVEWLCTGPPEVSAYVDRLILAAQLTSAGAKTAWGSGVVQILDRFARPEHTVD